MKNIKLHFILAALFIVTGCSGSSGGDSLGVHSGSAFVNLIVLHTTERDSRFLVGKITRFLVVVEGDNFDAIKLHVSANAHEMEIENILPGENRKITVTAFNRDDQQIRKGISELFSIAEGETKEVSITLEAIPVFINVHDGNVVSNRRLIFEVLADPSEPLAVEDVTASVESLTALSTGSNEVIANESTGVGYFNPIDVQLGERTFKARSLKTGRSSEVRLVITNSELRKPAPLYSAGNISPRNTNLEPSRLGQWSARPSRVQESPQGELWPNVLNQQLYLEVSR